MLRGISYTDCRWQMRRQQPYLFPAGAQFSRDNLVLHAAGRRHVVNDFAGPLSIKSVIRDEVHWPVYGRQLLVDSNTFLVLDDGQRYSMNQTAREYLHGNVDRAISLEEVSREACISRYHLHRAFKRVFRMTPHAYLTGLRLERARVLLQRGHAVTDAAMELGFMSLSAFSRLFRARYPLPPSKVPKIRKIGQAQR